MSTMVGVRELKNALSRYLRLAASGEAIVVCEHGRPLAILAPLPDDSAPPKSTAEHLASLAARGLVVLGVGGRRRKHRRGPRVDLSTAVIEGREDRG